jgi:dipeptidyl-peptidase-3
VKRCREFYVQLTEPTGVYLEWRRIMLAKKAARHVFVQPNTSNSGGKVFSKEYELTADGMIQIWVERMRMIREENEK